LASIVNTKLSIKICDFGLAKRILPGRVDKNTKNLCTVWYRPPEILAGQSYTETVDVWSLGCILYEFATMSILFNNDNDVQLIKTIFNTVAVTQADLNYLGLEWKLSECSKILNIPKIAEIPGCKGLVRFLSMMLIINPINRLSASALLAQKYIVCRPVITVTDKVTAVKTAPSLTPSTSAESNPVVIDVPAAKPSVFMRGPILIKHDVRKTLVAKMILIAQGRKMAWQTLALAVDLLDRLISVKKLTDDLLPTCLMSISSKIIEFKPYKLAHCLEFKLDQLVRFERKVLNLIKFNVASYTLLDICYDIGRPIDDEKWIKLTLIMMNHSQLIDKDYTALRTHIESTLFAQI